MTSSNCNVLEGMIGPEWTRGGIEKPIGEKNMGEWTESVYTEEQQERLNVDELGNRLPHNRLPHNRLPHNRLPHNRHHYNRIHNRHHHLSSNIPWESQLIVRNPNYIQTYYPIQNPKSINKKNNGEYILLIVIAIIILSYTIKNKK